jgi:hypothetical protein
MIRKIKLMFLALTMSLGLASALPALTFAADTSNNINSGLCTGVQDAAGGDPGGAGGKTACFNQSNDGTSALSKIAKQIINIFSILVGIVAVIMVIYGGFRYITSGGDSGRVGNAKNTLIYAIIGLVVVALAQFLVHFVLTTATSTV